MLQTFSLMQQNSDLLIIVEGRGSKTALLNLTCLVRAAGEAWDGIYS